jgi:hypothetical protein
MSDDLIFFFSFSKFSENEILNHDPAYNVFFDQLIASSTESIVDQYGASEYSHEIFRDS